MVRTKFNTDRNIPVAAAAAATAVGTTAGAVAVTADGATDLDVFSAAAVVDIAALITEMAAVRAKLGI